MNAKQSKPIAFIIKIFEQNFTARKVSVFGVILVRISGKIRTSKNYVFGLDSFHAVKQDAYELLITGYKLQLQILKKETCKIRRK